MNVVHRRLLPVVVKRTPVFVTVVRFVSGEVVEAPRRSSAQEADSFARLYAKLQTVDYVQIIMPDGTTRLYDRKIGV